MTWPRAQRRSDEDAGFALVEVIVALGIFMLVVTALLPQIMSGLRALSTADTSTVVKSVSQQEIERLRDLPFRVSLGGAVVNGAQTEADADLLDFYYPNKTTAAHPTATECMSGSSYVMPPSQSAWQGYVNDSDRCDYEPAGALYRTVNLETRAPLGSIAIIRDLQFLSAGTTDAPIPQPVEPGVYDSDYATKNSPPSSQVGVTITVLYRTGGQVRAHTEYTQIARHDVAATLLHSAVDVETLQVDSHDPNGAVVSLTAGMVGLEGTITDASVANANLSAVAARIATGDPATSLSAYGASRTYEAPGTTPVEPMSDEGLASCTIICWGRSEIGSDAAGGTVSSDESSPRAGSPAGPLRASVTGEGRDALAFDNAASYRSDLPLDRVNHAVSLLGAAPIESPSAALSQCPRGLIGSTVRLSGSAGMMTTPHPNKEGVLDTAMCGGAQSAAVAVLPMTPWAPDGVVQLRLRRSYAWCQVNDGVADGGGGLDVQVRVSDGHGGYQQEQSLQSVDPTADVPDRRPLSEYIPGWSFAPVTVDKSGPSVKVTVPGITVTTAPTRLAADGTPDQSSAVMITLGATSCSSQVGS